MIAHHGIAEYFVANSARWKLQPLTNEFPAVLLVRPGQRILTAKIITPYALIDAGKHLNLAIRQHISPISYVPCRPPSSLQLRTETNQN